MPGLHLYRSNHLPSLALLLGQLLKADPLRDPFTPEWVIIGNKGLEDWLTRSLAQELSICANVRFPFPMGFLGRALSSLEAARQGRPRRFAAEPPPDPWDVDALTWAVLATLPQFRDDPRFAPVTRWLDGGRPIPGAPTRRRYTLARRIAGAFDRVVVYRPGRAVDWSAGRVGGPLPADLTWQPPLWQAVQRRLSRRDQEAPHLAARIASLPQLLEGPLPTDFPRRVSVFGLSALPPLLLQAFATLGRVIDVNLLLLHPSDAIWERRSRRAPVSPDNGRSLLLGAFGATFRDFQEQLLALPEGLEDRTALVEHELFVPPERWGTQLLSTLQQDVFTHTQTRRGRAVVAVDAAGAPVASDDSVQVHACHGATRQVEVLRDALLGLLVDHPHLQPRDVLVLTPSMDTFAPLISAVFDAAPRGGGLPTLPYRLEDQSVRRTNPVAAALLAVLDLVDSRLQLPAVVDLLALEPVRLAFGISGEEVPQLAELLEKAGVRWGADGAWRARFDQPDDDRHTWRAGLDRLALGAAVADEWHLLAGTAPLDDVEGRGAVLAGKALAFGHALLHAVHALMAPRPVRAWVDTLAGTTEQPGLLDQLVVAPEGSGWLMERTRRVLLDLRQRAVLVGADEPVGLPTLRAHLTGRFEVPADNPRMPGGAVTFASLRPMRGVPHRVVALLGMDEGTLPRDRIDLRFDLCTRQPRTGDQDPRKEDRTSFLEAVLAAQEHLLVFYTGQDPQTDEERPPCGPVAELCEVLDQTATPVELPGRSVAPSTWLTTVHALQAFSPSAFVPDRLPPITQPGPSRPWSFDRELLAAARTLRDGARSAQPWLAASALPGAASPTPDVSLRDLIRFTEAPATWTLRTHLGLDLTDRSSSVPDREPLELDHLEAWRVRKQLSLALDRGLPIDEAEAVVWARTALPLGRAGQRALQHERRAVLWAHGALQAFLAGREREPVALSTDLEGVRLSGSLQVAAPTSETPLLVRLVVGSSQDHRMVAPWVELLLWTVATGGDDLVLRVVFVHSKGGVLTLRAPCTSRIQRLGWARGHLAGLVDRWKRGQRAVLPVFKKTTSAVAVAAESKGRLDVDWLMSHGGHDKGLQKAAYDAWAGRWDANGARLPGEGHEPLLRQAWGEPDTLGARQPWRDEDGLSEAFVREAVSLWRPLLRARREGDTVAVPPSLTPPPEAGA